LISMTKISSRRVVESVIVLTLILVAIYFCIIHVKNKFTDNYYNNNAHLLTLHSKILSDEFTRFRILAVSYSHNPVIESFLSPSNQEKLSSQTSVLNNDVTKRLKTWLRFSGLLDVRLLNKTGTIISQANSDNTAKIKRFNFADTEYFSEAHNGSLGREMSVDHITGKLSYFMSHPVRFNGETVGVLVLVISVDEIQQDMRTNPHEIFVTDQDGLILLAGHPGWRLKALSKDYISKALNNKAEKKFKISPLHKAPIQITPVNGLTKYTKATALADRSNSQPIEFLKLSRPMTVEGWILHIMIPINAVNQRLIINFVAAFLGILVLTVICFAIWQRRKQLLELVREREKAQHTLEKKVVERTLDLKKINQKLLLQIDKRKRVEKKLRRTESELIHAGKMASLGQMSTELRHELNQPLSAIRNYAENIKVLLTRKKYAMAAKNIEKINYLIERIEKLSQALTIFARRPKEIIERVSLNKVIHDSVDVLQPTFEKREIKIQVSIPENIWVLGEETMLQNVFVNLFKNSLDATKTQPKPFISCSVIQDEDVTRVIIEDNGSGISKDLIDGVFEPFFTTKESGEGLGLGLSISFDTIKRFGGKLTVEKNTNQGAKFIAELLTFDNQGVENEVIKKSCHLS